MFIWKEKQDSCGWSPPIKALTQRFHDIQMSLSVSAWWLRTCPEGDSETLMDQLIQWAISSGVEEKDSIRSYQNVSRCVPGKGAWDSSTKRHWSKGFSLYWPFTAPVYKDTCIGSYMASVYTAVHCNRIAKVMIFFNRCFPSAPLMSTLN